SLVFTEIECLAPPVINPGKHDGPAVSHSKLIANKRRYSAWIESVLMVKKIPRVERRVAQELKRAAVHQCATRFGDHIGEASRAVPDLRGHHSRTGLHFLNGIHVEIG